MGFAQLSNNLVYSAIAVYVLALVGFSADLAARPVARRRVPAPVPTPVPAPVRAHAGGGPAGGVPVAGDGPAPEVSPRRPVGRVAVSLTVLGFALHLAGLVARGLAAGRVPWGNMYEFSSAAALAVTAVFLLLLLRYDVRYLGVFVMVPVVSTLGLAVTVLYVPAGALVPSLDSYWLVIHVSAAVLSAGAFTLGAAVSVLYLLRARAERRDTVGALLGRFPPAAVLDRTAYQIHAFVFPLWTFAIIAGAIWAENAWGRYWGWDPKETWAFITWVVYAGYLHARATAGWRGQRTAVIALVGFTAFLFNYFGVNLLITGLHSYAR
ncbi:MAG: c-type cytochrome biogenesis protein CcsB [Actinomycetota bacterium]